MLGLVLAFELIGSSCLSLKGACLEFIKVFLLKLEECVLWDSLNFLLMLGWLLLVVI